MAEGVFSAVFGAEDRASGVIRNIVAASGMMGQSIDAANPPLRALGSTMQGVIKDSELMQEALTNVADVQGMPKLEKQLVSIDKKIAAAGKRLLKAERLPEETETKGARVSAAQVEISSLIKEESALRDELSRRMAITITDSDRAVVAYSQQAAALREQGIEGKITGSVLDGYINKLQTINATLQQTGAGIPEIPGQIEQLQQIQAAVKANEEYKKSVQAGTQVSVNLGRTLQETNVSTTASLGAFDAQLQTVSNQLFNASNQIINTARSSVLYQEALRLLQTGQEGLVTEEMRGFIALDALGVRMRQMATGEAPMTSSSVARLASSMTLLNQSTGISTEAMGISSPILQNMARQLKVLEKQAGDTGGGMKFMGDVGVGAQNSMRGVSSAAQGFMLALSLADKNIMGTAFSLIFMQFSGILKLSLGFSALSLAAIFASRKLADIWKQKQDAKALADAMFVVTGSTEAYTKSVEIADKITKGLGLTGDLQAEASEALAKAFATMRLQGIEPTIDSAKDFLDFFFILKASTKGGKVNLEEMVRDFIQFRKDGTGAMTEIARGPDEVARALFLLQQSVTDATVLTAEQLQQLATAFSKAFGVEINEKILSGITTIDQFKNAASAALISFYKDAAPPVGYLDRFVGDFLMAQTSTTGAIDQLKKDLETKWKEIGAGAASTGGSFIGLSNNAKTAGETINTVVDEAVKKVDKLKGVREAIENAVWPEGAETAKKQALSSLDELIKKAEAYLQLLLAIIQAEQTGAPLPAVTTTGEAPPETISEEGGLTGGNAGWAGYQQTSTGGNKAAINVNVDVHDNKIDSPERSRQLGQEIADQMMASITRGSKFSGIPVIQ